MTKIIISIALAIAVVLFNYMYISSVKLQYESGEFAMVVQAKENVAKWSVVNPEDVEVVQIDAKLAEGNQISLPGKKGNKQFEKYLIDQVVMHIAQSPISRGKILSQSDIAENLDNAFSRKIPDGQRAVTVPVDEATGVAGLIRPGDRVDLVGTFQVDAGRTAQGVPIKGLYTQTILQNIEVLAVGKDAGIGLAEELVSNPLAASAQFTKPTSLTLAVSPQQSQIVIHVRSAGKLSASLRPGPFRPGEGTEALSPIKDSDVLDTDALIILKDEVFNPFLQSAPKR